MANHGVLPSPAEIRELLLDLEVALDYGGLDPQIRNQPLSPRTPILLRMLVQQIKQLQKCQQQLQQVPLMGFAQIAHHEQQIRNLQTEIRAEQEAHIMAEQEGGHQN